jgi:hypothetical protein
MPITQTPLKAIRAGCLGCAGSPSTVRDCQGDTQYDGPCLFFRYRLGEGRPSVKLIRKYCLQCMNESPKLVKECQSCLTCPLHSYRLARNPKRVAVRRDFPIRINEIVVGDSQVRVGGKMKKIASKTPAHEGESRAQIGNPV